MAMDSSPKDLNLYSQKCQDFEKEIASMQKKLTALSKCDPEILINEFDIKDEEFLKLMQENKKLNYRINVMKNGIDDRKKKQKTVTSNEGKVAEKKTSKTDVAPKNMPLSLSDFDLSGSHMVNLLGYTEAFFTQAILKAYPEAKLPLNVQIQVSKMADYQCNAAMSLAKMLNKNPKEVGQNILEAAGQSPVISKMELSGPGFINVTLSKDFIKKQVGNLIRHGVTPPSAKKQRIVVDFSSPNIAKEMHVGHLRSTIIGDSICRLLEFLGHDVLRLNHLGDWGTQFGMLIAHLKDRFPTFATETPAISDLQSFYKESKQRFDEDAEFKQRAYEAVVKLQSHDPIHIEAWKRICSISEAEFQKVYERLQVKIVSRGESFYQTFMEDLVKDFDKKGFLSLEDGRKVMYADGAEIPLTIVKSDGGFTYDTSDMACILHRLKQERGERLIYVTDAGQMQHFKSFFACARRADFYDPAKTKIDHVTFGVVLGEDKKKFKTRSGDTVRLVDLLEEGLERAAAKLREKERDGVLTPEEFIRARDAVGYGCIKYADLSHDRTRDYVFSFDRMLDFRGNTAAYLLYALTRIRSIARNAGVDRNRLLKELESSNWLVYLDHEREWKLAATILKMANVIVKMAADLYVHPLCEFLYELSTTFTEFYDVCYCIDKDSSGQIKNINMPRLLLCEATALVMEKSFHLLGITTLQKM